MTALVVSRWTRRLLTLLVALLGACAVGPEVPKIYLELAARALPQGDVRWQREDPAAAGVRVWRGATELRASAGMLLQVGDIVETGPAAAAVIRFRPAGTTVLDTGTRVRIGSLEVFFGRVFANVRGLFQTSSDTVVAGVSGTRFVFQVRPDRQTRVAVIDGEVTCAPRQGGWTPVRLSANQVLTVDPRSRGAVQVTPVDPREMRDVAEWAQQVSSASVEGWCCVAPGRLERTWENRCGSGRFSSERFIAEGLCRERADPVGYCCNDGALERRPRSQCPGRFSDSEADARRQCRSYTPPPDSTPPVTVPQRRSGPSTSTTPVPRSIPAPRPPPPPVIR